MKITDILLRLLDPVMDRNPDFVIGTDADPYLARWYVIPRNPLFNIYLHKIMRSDDDRALHDHPWANISIILSGAYIEHTILTGGIHVKNRRRKGDWHMRGPRTAHRLELDHGTCWTLFITGPKVRVWGFCCPQGWRPWYEFVDQRDNGRVGRGCE